MEKHGQAGLGECAICLEDLKSDLSVLPCHPTHLFHDTCIKGWVATQTSPPAGPCRLCQKLFYLLFKKPVCPICRAGFSQSHVRSVS